MAHRKKIIVFNEKNANEIKRNGKKNGKSQNY